jgi:hypothetical protein
MMALYGLVLRGPELSSHQCGAVFLKHTRQVTNPICKKVLGVDLIFLNLPITCHVLCAMIVAS